MKNFVKIKRKITNATTGKRAKGMNWQFTKNMYDKDTAH